MNHQLAVNTRATERYMLGELDEESRSAFEEHYFSCGVCADDVRAAVQFVDNAKAVMTAEQGRVRFGAQFWNVSRIRAWAVPAALAACLAIGYILPHPGRNGGEGPGAGVVMSFAVPTGARGASTPASAIMPAADTSLLMVRLDVADDVTAPRLLWRVRTGAGQELRFQTARENQTVLPLRAADFPAGRYEIALSADSPNAPMIDRYPFAIGQR